VARGSELASGPERAAGGHVSRGYRAP
jgi:hypothetical protein